MKKIFFPVCLCICCLHVYAQQHYAIAAWKDNKKAALSLTFDDAINGQFTVALPLLQQHHLKATFFITTSNIDPASGEWNLIGLAAKDGDEIANHTVSHPYMQRLTPDSMAYEFDECNKIIEQHIPSVKVETMAYPYGDGGDLTDSEQVVRNVAYHYFIAARSVEYRGIFYNPYKFAGTNDDYYRVNSEMIENAATVNSFPRHLDSAIKLGIWYVPTYHGIQTGWMIVPKWEFEKNLQAIDKRKKLLWIASFADVAKYNKERDCAAIHVLKNDVHLSVIIITDTLPASTWNESLTINYNTTANIKNIEQGSKKIYFTEKDGLVSFNIIPSSKKIIIAKG